MSDGGGSLRLHQLTTHRAAAVAGVIFAVTFATSVLLLRSTVPTDGFAGTEWVETGESRITVALGLMPLTGIAFLWFIGVLRDLSGGLEGRFFSTVFLGSGLLFLAMMFVTMAVLGGLLATVRAGGDPAAEVEAVGFGHAVMLQVSNVYGLRMAAVFMITLGTIWRQTGIMPRWMVAITYVIGLSLLLVPSLDLYLTLTFSAWVLGISLFVLLSPPPQLLRRHRPK